MGFGSDCDEGIDQVGGGCGVLGSIFRRSAGLRSRARSGESNSAILRWVLVTSLERARSNSSSESCPSSRMRRRSERVKIGVSSVSAFMRRR